MKAKRFLLFGMDNYYPQGGFNDLMAMADTLEEINKKALKLNKKRDYFEIIDLEDFDTDWRFESFQEESDD